MSEIKLESCLHCKSEGLISFYRDCQDYYLGKSYRANYVRCTQCGLVQQSPLPKSEELATFYDAYPIHQQKSFLHRWMRQWVMSSVYFSDAAQTGKRLLLDYGCGDGWFLERKKEKSGYDSSTLIGFEQSEQHAKALSARIGISVEWDSQTLLQKYSSKVDVVTMHFVLEHLTDLNLAFEQVKSLLKPGGTFYFVVPNIESFESKFFGKKWHNLDSPRHLSFPGDSVVETLASQWGFQVKKVRALSFPNGFAGSLPVWLTGKFNFKLFLVFLPIGFVFSWLVPNGARGYWLQRVE